jgi:hypothetical protein
MKRWLRIATFAACLLALGGLRAGLEAQSTFVANKGEKRLKVRYLEFCVLDTNSTTYVPIMSTQITIPAGWTSGRIVARFSTLTKCRPSNYCSVQLLVNGALMSPGSGFDYAFDSPAGEEFGSNYESNSVERTSGELGPGTYTVAVQGGVVGSGTFFEVCGPTLVLTLWRVS